MAGGISSSTAAEHRLAAEWTAKLAAENRRKLQGGRGARGPFFGGAFLGKSGGDPWISP